MSNKHKDLQDDQLHVCKGHEAAEAGTHVTKDEQGEQLWEKRPVLYPVLQQANPNAAPPAEVMGNIYLLVQTGVTMDVDTIAWQSGTTVRYTMTGDFTMLGSTSALDYMHVTGATNPKHNGSFVISTVNAGAGWVEITNATVTSAGDDEAASPATATTTHANWDGANTNAWVRFNGTLWYGIAPFEGLQVFDENINAMLVFNGTSWTTSTVAAASETVAGIAEIATQAEVIAGTDDARIVTPSKLINWWIAVKAAAATISGIWTFTSEKFRIKNSASVWYHIFKSDATGNQTWTLPDEGNQTFASRAYADALVTGLWDDRGTFDASVNAYPSSGGSGTAGAILKGDIWTISVAGTLPTGVVVVPGDTVRALIDTPGNTQANWAVAEMNLGYTPVPYTGATSDVDLGANALTADEVISRVATGDSRVILDAAAATDAKILSWRTGNSKRWAMRVDGAGDDFALRRYDNSGTYVASPIRVDRTTGKIILDELTASELFALNASKEITSLSTAAYPSPNELSYVKGVTSAIQTQLDAKKDTFIYLALYGGATVVTDSSVWYFFNSGIAPTAGNSPTDNDYNFGFAVKLIGATVGVYGNTTAGSAENVTLELRNTTQATTSSIGTFQSNGGSATVTAHFTFTGLNISAGASDYICLKITNPAWATNPVGVTYRVTLIFEKT